MIWTCTQNERKKRTKESIEQKSRRKEGVRKTEGRVVEWSGERFKDTGRERGEENGEDSLKTEEKATRGSPLRTIVTIMVQEQFVNEKFVNWLYKSNKRFRVQKKSITTDREVTIYVV